MLPNPIRKDPGVVFRDVLQQMGGKRAIAAYGGIDDHIRKVLYQLASCGTGYFGTNMLQCGDCDTKMSVPRTCHSRYCPTCVGKAGQEWAQSIEDKLLPTAYFHVIFTVPNGLLRTLMRSNQRQLYDLLLNASKDTLLGLSAEQQPYGGVPSLLQVLHTTNQMLGFHPHVHALVSGGSFNKKDDQWVPCKDPKFLFPYECVASSFRKRFLEGLQELYTNNQLSLTAPSLHPLTEKEAFEDLVKSLGRIDWNVEIIETFNGPTSVVRYLARYTHRTAISNARLLALNGDTLTIAYKDRSRDTQKASGNPAGVDKTLVLTLNEFMRRFNQHILPKGFHRIRRSGLLAPAAKKAFNAARLAAHQAVEEGTEPRQPEPDAEDPILDDPGKVREPSRCCNCNSDQLILVASIIRRGPNDYERIEYDQPTRGSPTGHRSTSAGTEA
jgi:hypothetical protein